MKDVNVFYGFKNALQDIWGKPMPVSQANMPASAHLWFSGRWLAINFDP